MTDTPDKVRSIAPLIAAIAALLTAATGAYIALAPSNKTKSVAAAQSPNDDSAAKLLGYWRYRVETTDKSNGVVMVRIGTIQYLQPGSYNNIGELVLRLPASPNSELRYDILEAGEWSLDGLTLHTRVIDVKSIIYSAVINGKSLDPNSPQTKAQFPLPEDVMPRGSAYASKLLQVSDSIAVLTMDAPGGSPLVIRLEKSGSAWSR